MAIDIEAYYQSYQKMILNRCRLLVKDEQKAFDILHDTFVQLTRHQARLEDRAPASLLYRIATNLCLNHLRKERRHRRLEEALLIDTNARDAESKVIARDLLSKLFVRKEKRAAAWTLAVDRYLNRMTIGELAREMQMSYSGIRKRLRRLRAELAVVTE